MRVFKSLFALTSAMALAVMLPGCSTSPDDATVTIEDLVVGSGAVVVSNDTISVDYVGTFATSGSQFDSGANFVFRVGQGAVIKGWDEGIPGMRVGGTRRLTIPPELAYGKAGNGTIPGNSTLKFDVTLKVIAGK